jgi:hypothetical protein
MLLSQGEHRRCRAFVPLFQLSFDVLHLKLGRGKLAMGMRKTQVNLFISIVMGDRKGPPSKGSGW